MTPARTWLLVVGISAAAAAGVLALASALESRRPPSFQPAPIYKVDFHQHVGPATARNAMALATSQGIRALVNLAGGPAGEGLEEQVAAASPYPERMLVFAGLDWAGCCGEEWAGRELARLARARAAGARGLQVYLSADAAAARLAADSPRLDPLWDLCAEAGFPVAVHLARSPADGRAALRQELARLAERRPRNAFVAQDFAGGASDPAEVGRLLDRLGNLHVDLAASLPELGRHAEAARAAVLAHPDRVLFGTDLQWLEGPDVKAVILGAGAPATAPEEVRRFFESTFRFLETRDREIPSPVPALGSWSLEGLGLPPEVLVRVYHRNAERLLGLPPGGGR